MARSSRSDRTTSDAADGHLARSLPPRTPYEDAVVGILGDVLGHTDVDVEDRLLALGDVSQAPRIVAQIRKTMGVDVPVADYVESGTVAGLAAAVAAKSFAARATTRPRALEPRPPDARPVLSFDQQRLWMENQLLPGVIYNVHGRRRILGPLDVAVVEASVRAIIGRHETLRTRFPAGDGEPVQVVDPPGDQWRIRIEDLGGLRAEGGDELVERAARRLLDEELTTPFDLATGPLIRCLLVRLGDTEHLLGVTMHHIVSDAWSIGLFVRELTALYEAGGDPERAGLRPLPVQYRDYGVWQRGWLTGDALEYQVGHWRRQLRDAPRFLAMPTVQRRTNALRAEAGQVLDALSREETAALHELCRTHGVTSFMVLYAVLTTIFSRWAGQSDIVVGVPVAGRNTSLTDRLIGFFINMLPLRVDLSDHPSFGTLLERVRRIALDGYAHAEAPMDELVRDLGVARDPRRTPLFEVVLNVVASPEAEEVTSLAIEPMETPSLFSRYDLTLTAQESAGVLRFKLDFPADRCDEPTGRALLRQLRTLLAAGAADPAVRLFDQPAEIPVGDPVTEAPADPPAPHLVVARHAGEPDLTAVVDGGGRWSYRWLALATDRVAEALAARGVTAADRVGVVRRPTAGFLAILTGAAKAGVTATVIETDDPALTGPLGLTTVLDAAPADAPAAGTIDVSAILPADPAPREQTTAGSDRFVVLSARPGLLMSAMCSAFAAGATMVIPECSFAGDGTAVVTWLREKAVSVAYLDPPILRALSARSPVPDLPALSRVIVDNAGDLLPHDVAAVREMSPECRCVAVYRVSPDGRPAASYDVPPELDAATSPLRVPLGTPAPGSALTVRRPSGQAAAIGELAEIWYDGERTGDLGRRWPGGRLEYAYAGGAVDPMDTVSALRDVPGVRDAVVIERAGNDGTPMRIGYVAAPDQKPSTMMVHGHLKARLPDYLVPDHLFVLDALPRTPWGAYDLRALPLPAGDEAAEDGYAAPRTPVERQLTAMLEELLGIERVGVYDSFFELGGFSMLATRLITRVRDAFGVQLAVRDVFESPTVDELARLVVRAQADLSGPDFEALLTEIEQTTP
jgi:non-ribosomal peptide synthetase component F